MSDVFLNGAFVPPTDARLSAFDAGVQHGVGLFETMLGGIGAPGEGADGKGRGEPAAWIFRLEDHLDRLISSARDLGLSDAIRKPALAEAVLETVRRSGHARARVRLTLTGGDLNLLSTARAGQDGGRSLAPSAPTVLIAAQPATEYPPGFFERGVGVVIADWRANPLDPMVGHKTLNYWQRLRELGRASAAGAGEAIVFQVSNHLAGGCVSNLFLVWNGQLLTPIARGEEALARAQRSPERPRGEHEEHARAGGRPNPPQNPAAPAGGASIPSPVLPGITRTAIIEWAERRGTKVLRKMLTIDDLLGADEVFLTNSSWGVLPVVRVERETIGEGTVGEVTRGAREAWIEAVHDAGEG